MKSKPERLHIVQFSVRGHGPFPIDMMRYDRSTPATEDAARLIERTFGSCYRAAEWTIPMIGFFFTTDGPTVRRWASFGWEVIPHE